MKLLVTGGAGKQGCRGRDSLNRRNHLLKTECEKGVAFGLAWQYLCVKGVSLLLGTHTAMEIRGSGYERIDPGTVELHG